MRKSSIQQVITQIGITELSYFWVKDTLGEKVFDHLSPLEREGHIKHTCRLVAHILDSKEQPPARLVEFCKNLRGRLKEAAYARSVGRDYLLFANHQME